MLSINTNLSSLIAQNSMKTSSDKLNQAIERMTTGFKINHAKDNAANYSISTDMTTKIGAYQVAEDNALQGLDMINTASDSLSLIQDKLERLRALATQASNGTYGAQSLKAIHAEANALVDEIERQYNTTEYNGINLAKGKVISTEESKFIKDIDRRDTSKMTTLASVAIDEALTSGTYSISTADELAKLATMTNNGLIGASTEFVLANDIDLQAWCDANGSWVPIGLAQTCTAYNITGNDIPFAAVFDGNGFVVNNLIASDTDVGRTHIALFGVVCDGDVRNLGIENCNIKSYSSAAPLISYCLNGVIDNCYAEGFVEVIRDSAAGFISGVTNCRIFDSYTSVELNSSDSGAFLSNCGYEDSILENCHVLSSNSNVKSVFGKVAPNVILTLKNCSYNSYYEGMSIPITVGIGQVIQEGYCLSRDIFDDISIGKINLYDLKTVLQIGNDSNFNSQISLNLGFDLDGLFSLANIAYKYNDRNVRKVLSEADFCSHINLMLSKISDKQTEYGAVQNRLESALDEISIKYENLVSSRSTLRDADIAKVSSTYIQQQILQQASATLMATANQSPAIALQLI